MKCPHCKDSMYYSVDYGAMRCSKPSCGYVADSTGKWGVNVRGNSSWKQTMELDKGITADQYRRKAEKYGKGYKH